MVGVMVSVLAIRLKVRSFKLGHDNGFYGQSKFAAHLPSEEK
jgi:hypothetical protein